MKKISLSLLVSLLLFSSVYANSDLTPKERLQLSTMKTLFKLKQEAYMVAVEGIKVHLIEYNNLTDDNEAVKELQKRNCVDVALAAYSILEGMKSLLVSRDKPLGKIGVTEQQSEDLISNLKTFNDKNTEAAKNCSNVPRSLRLMKESLPHLEKAMDIFFLVLPNFMNQGGAQGLSASCQHPFCPSLEDALSHSLGATIRAEYF